MAENDKNINVLKEMLEEQRRANEQLAQAIIDSRKPHDFEAKEAEKAKRKASMKEKEKNRIAGEKALQARCPHMRSDKSTTYWRREVVGQHNTTNHVMLICCRCEHQLHSNKPEDAVAFARWFPMTIAAVDVA